MDNGVVVLWYDTNNYNERAMKLNERKNYA